MTKYLYGAAVQGIQDFIFQTNKLREIVGASELVEEICTKKFYEILSGEDVSTQVAQERLSKDDNAILHAAGNVKYIFTDNDSCKKVVERMPMEIQKFAPGITFSQAVVKMEGEYEDYSKASDELEFRLKIQRNRPMRSQTLGLMGIKRSQKSGLPLVDFDLDIVREKTKRFDEDDITLQLCKKAFGDKYYISNKVICRNIEQMTQYNDWIAIIHCDGNGLGSVVQSICKDEQLSKKFSEKLDKATIESAQIAFDTIASKTDIDGKYKFFNPKKFIPIRPIVLSGDDFTVICRADFALEYISVFIENFQEKTSFISDYNIGMERLTACAGIAFVKSSFPFYYGYSLSEELCKTAKSDTKDKFDSQSCLMFHKVQDTFTEDYEDIVERELKPCKDVSFKFGPYYLEKQEGRWSIDYLLEMAEKLDSKEGNAVKSHLRQWMSILHEEGWDVAEQKLKRLKSITSMKDYVNTVSDKLHDNAYPVYDILAIHSINTQVTKEVNDEH